jgi:hypothetical protein
VRQKNWTKERSSDCTVSYASRSHPLGHHYPRLFIPGDVSDSDRGDFCRSVSNTLVDKALTKATLTSGRVVDVNEEAFVCLPTRSCYDNMSKGSKFQDSKIEIESWNILGRILSGNQRLVSSLTWLLLPLPPATPSPLVSGRWRTRLGTS